MEVHVKSEQVDPFVAATQKNAQNSLQEAGVARFDVLQDQADPCHFMVPVLPFQY